VIQRPSNYLAFETEDGVIPCAVDDLAVELVGDGIVGLSTELLREASLGLLKYFREDLGREQVTVAEFAQALASVLQGFGFELKLEAAAEGTEGEAEPQRVAEIALDELVNDGEVALAGGFFPRIRSELHRRLEDAPTLVRLTGLRSCVKRLSKSPRWNGRCQRLNDQIVTYLRLCFAERPPGADCTIMMT
jgi:hypothetical protein